MIPRIRLSPSAILTRLRPIGPRCSRTDHLRPHHGHAGRAGSRRALSTTPPSSQLQKPSQTTPAAPPPQPTPETSSPRPGFLPPPPPPKRRLLTPTRLILSALFLTLGLLNGHAVRQAISPASPPTPSSPADLAAHTSIQSLAAQLPLVRALSTSPAWRSFPAYSSIAPSAQAVRLTTGPLSGTRGIGGYQTVFHNSDTGEFVSVIYLGAGICGWPGVVHGGALATVLDESLGRCAISRLPAGTGVTARLEVRYRAPTTGERFYVVRCKPEEVEEKERGKGDRKVWVRGTLETVEGGVCVEARGLFVVPRGLSLQKLGEEF